MRGRGAGALTLAVLLAGCGESSDPVKDKADVAEVRAMHDMPPIQPISPQRISYTDIEENNLFGKGCGFAPQNSAGILFLAQEKHGFLKLDGKIRTLAPDMGSKELPMQARSAYDGKEFTVALTMDAVAEEHDGIKKINHPGAMSVTDAKGRVVYQAKGLIGCGS